MKRVPYFILSFDLSLFVITDFRCEKRNSVLPWSLWIVVLFLRMDAGLDEGYFQGVRLDATRVVI